MQNTVLSEEVRYEAGKRVMLQTIETVTTLADDMTTLANYYNALASHQTQVERLQERMPQDEVQSRSFRDEITRLTTERGTLEQAIAIQQGFVRGFEDGTV